MSQLNRPIFIWGAPRSGTTLLYNLLAKHPDVGYLGLNEGKPREGTGFWWRAFGEHRSCMDTNLVHPRSIKQIKKEYFTMLKNQGKSRLLDKTPFMTLWIPLVNAVFPESRHFHIIRDGRAVVNSILYILRYSKKEKHYPFKKEELMFGPQPPELIDPLSQPQALRHVRQWIHLVEHGQCNAEILGKRYFELRYEDLVVATQNTMKSVLEHAQLSYDERFVNENFPANLENRNYKWKIDKQHAIDNGFTAHKAIEDEDFPYFKKMEPILRSLGYDV